MSQKTVTINGRQYDAHTGMPIADLTPEEVKPAEASAPHESAVQHHIQHSQSVHAHAQKSQTLNRQIVKKPHDTVAVAPAAHHRSSAITKFAPQTQSHPTKSRVMTDIGPTHHPAIAKANTTPAHPAVKTKTAPKPSHVIKNEAIAEALDKAPSKKEQKHHAKRRKTSRFLSVASASLALLLLGGYFTYINMPNLSVRVAAAQAGVNASYPDYHPDGYSLNGPVAYTQGQVSMKFAANAGPQNYTIEQSKSNWDSSAVLDNYVKKKAGDNYITYNERGLTIYTFDGNAAWVNGGILYTISGNAPLSSDQIRRIATSM